MEWWGLSPYAAPHLNGLMMKLGADIPACLACRPVRMSGAGDILTPVLPLPESPVVLINPGKPCSTAQVFAAFRGPFSQPVGALDDLHDFDELAWFIEEQGNDLLPAAIGIVPEITAAIENLQAQPGCAAAGMSGSGATCFGLFREEDDALQAVESLQTAQPAWWVRGGTLNRPERY
jgi:4-diphosphocytidyl-2-C-methyl-D-erythritol kinase